MNHAWTMRQVSQIDMNSSKASPTSEVSQHPAPEGTPSMHSAWWEHRGACAGCRKVESYSWRVGLFVSGKLLVVVNVHQAPNMLELVAESTLCRISKIDEAGALWWGWLPSLVDQQNIQESPLPCPRMLIFRKACPQHWCLEGWRWDPSAGHRGPQRSGACKEKVQTAAARKRTLKSLSFSAIGP